MHAKESMLTPPEEGARGLGALLTTHPGEAAPPQQCKLGVGGSREVGVGGWNFAEISCCGIGLPVAAGCCAELLAYTLEVREARAAAAYHCLGGVGRCRRVVGGRTAVQQHGESSLHRSLSPPNHPVLRAEDQLMVLNVHMRTPLCNDLHGDDQIVEMADVGDNLGTGATALQAYGVSAARTDSTG